jgi:acyl-coenzyme A thioesterase PaaI-like protein
VTNEDQRIVAASLLRELGHEFVARDLSDDQLDALASDVRTMLETLRDTSPRIREFADRGIAEFALTIPTFDEIGERQLHPDSFVAGAANPMGLAAQLWRDGDAACMRVTLGRAFEGAPGRAHGGVVAALLDDVMGAVNIIHGAMALTVQLDITYHAPTPVGEPIVARAWLARRDEKKLFVEATVHNGDVLVASGKGLFIAIDRSAFLERLLNVEG